ncbi:leucine-rich repeat domain-containing protein [Microscilla marina]|uniref:Leucine-rich protein n=1 Tax=Microscilla marina ATCC 23134 TaxID=313606 RepID=A1ZD46_MICM2|nr:leucine-rich repeat domain-containing protein [Microscilla marina]EAY31585.1 leucine-rich protein [Microscilla marina ATCC 23134]
MSQYLTLPFGKYKGLTVSQLKNDLPYVKWLLNQPWLSDKVDPKLQIALQGLLPQEDFTEQSFLEVFRKNYPHTAIEELQEIALDNRRISRLSTDIVSEKIKILKLAKNQISKIEGLERLRNLQLLDLSNNKIAVIENLHYLGKLKQLYLNGNCINKIENMEFLRGIEFLSLGKNKIKVIENLEQLPYLRSIELYPNPLQFITMKSYQFLQANRIRMYLGKSYKKKRGENLRIDEHGQAYKEVDAFIQKFQINILNDARTLNFGKYKNQPFQLLQNDKPYVRWLLDQDWIENKLSLMEIAQLRKSLCAR